MVIYVLYTSEIVFLRTHYFTVIHLLHCQRKPLLTDKSSPLSKQITMENMAELTWDGTVSWGEDCAPVTMQCLKAMFPSHKTIATHRMLGPRRHKR